MRRQFSNSAVISTGQPTRVKMKDDVVVLVGAAAHIDAVGLDADEARNRQAAGRGSLPACVGPTAEANVSRAAMTARSHAIISLPCRNSRRDMPRLLRLTRSQAGQSRPAL